MSHCQIFYPFNNEDGYISVVCHRERFLDGLLSLGWCKTADEAIACGPDPNPEVITELEPVTVAEAREGGHGYKDEPMSIAGLSNKQRKKLSLKK